MTNLDIKQFTVNVESKGGSNSFMRTLSSEYGYTLLALNVEGCDEDDSWFEQVASSERREVLEDVDSSFYMD